MGGKGRVLAGRSVKCLFVLFWVVLKICIVCIVCLYFFVLKCHSGSGFTFGLVVGIDRLY